MKNVAVTCLKKWGAMVPPRNTPVSMCTACKVGHCGLRLSKIYIGWGVVDIHFNQALQYPGK